MPGHDLEPIDITVSLADYVKKHEAPKHDGLATDVNGNVLGHMRPVSIATPEGGTQLVWAFKPDEER